jgi:hypothetical protein
MLSCNFRIVYGPDPDPDEKKIEGQVARSRVVNAISASAHSDASGLMTE